MRITEYGTRRFKMEKIEGFDERYALGQVMLEGRQNFFNTTYGVLWLLTGELRVALKNGNVQQAKAAVDAFSTLLRAKLENGERDSRMLFSAIRITEASGAGVYPRKPSPSLTASDMTDLWRLVESIPLREWSNYYECPSTCEQMIMRALGKE